MKKFISSSQTYKIIFVACVCKQNMCDYKYNGSKKESKESSTKEESYKEAKIIFSR
jgi:hypothetical protein